MPRGISSVWVLAATILGSSLVFIDSTVVSLALPVIQRELSATALQMQWVIEAYTLVLGALMLLCGALGDRYGRKRLFVGGVVIFAIGSFLCGVAPNIGALVAARVLQGVGGTMLAPASLAILGACFTGGARGKAIGTWSALTAIASTLGPVLGGVIIDHLGWRWAFYINLPVAAAVTIITLVHVPESRDDDETGALDMLGSFLITAGLGLVVYAFVTSGSSGWDATTIATLVLGVISMGIAAWQIGMAGGGRSSTVARLKSLCAGLTTALSHNFRWLRTRLLSKAVNSRSMLRDHMATMPKPIPVCHEPAKQTYAVEIVVMMSSAEY